MKCCRLTLEIAGSTWTPHFQLNHQEQVPKSGHRSSGQLLSSSHLYDVLNTALPTSPRCDSRAASSGHNLGHHGHPTEAVFSASPVVCSPPDVCLVVAPMAVPMLQSCHQALEISVMGGSYCVLPKLKGSLQKSQMSLILGKMLSSWQPNKQEVTITVSTLLRMLKV